MATKQALRYEWREMTDQHGNQLDVKVEFHDEEYNALEGYRITYRSTRYFIPDGKTGKSKESPDGKEYLRWLRNARLQDRSGTTDLVLLANIPACDGGKIKVLTRYSGAIMPAHGRDPSNIYSIIINNEDPEYFDWAGNAKLWSTEIIGGTLHGNIERYVTQKEAIAGHERWVASARIEG